MEHYLLEEKNQYEQYVIEIIKETKYQKAKELLNDLLYSSQPNEYVGMVKSHSKIKDLYSFLAEPKITNKEKVDLLEALSKAATSNPYIFDSLFLPFINGNFLYHFVQLYFREITQEAKDEKLLTQLLHIISIYIKFSTPHKQVYSFIFDKLRSYYIHHLCTKNIHKQKSHSLMNDDNLDISRCLNLLTLLYKSPNDTKSKKAFPKNYLIHNGNTCITYNINSNFRFQSTSYFRIMTWFYLKHSGPDMKHAKLSDNKALDFSNNLIEVILDDQSYVRLYFDEEFQSINLTYHFGEKNKKEEVDKCLSIKPRMFYFLDFWFYASSSLFSSKLNIKVDLYSSDSLLKNPQQLLKNDVCKGNKREIKNVILYRCFQGITTSTVIIGEETKKISDMDIPEKIIKYGISSKKTLNTFLNIYVTKGNKLQMKDIAYNIQTPFDYYFDKNGRLLFNDIIKGNDIAVSSAIKYIKDTKENQEMQFNESNIYTMILPHRYDNVFKRIFYIGGIKPFIPMFEIIKANNSIEQFETCFQIITDIIIESKYNYITAIEDNFFKAINVILTSFSKNYFTQKIWKCFTSIKDFFCYNEKYFKEYYNNKIEKYNSFFDDIFTNIQFIDKFNLAIKEEAWKIISSFYDKFDFSHLCKNINIDNIAMYLLHLDKQKYNSICCKTHNEYLRYSNNEKEFLNPDLKTQLNVIKENIFINLFKLEFKQEQYSNKNGCNALINLLLLDISPCLKVLIAKAIYSFLTNLTSEEAQQLVIKIFNRRSIEVLFHAIDISTFDVKELILSIIIEIDKLKLGILNTDDVIRTCQHVLSKEEVLNVFRIENEHCKIRFKHRNSFRIKSKSYKPENIIKQRRKSFDKTNNNDYNLSQKIFKSVFPRYLNKENIIEKHKNEVSFYLPLISKQKYILYLENIFEKIFSWYQFQMNSDNIDTKNPDKSEKLLHHIASFTNDIHLLSLYKKLFFNLTLLLSEKYRDKINSDSSSKKAILTSSLHSSDFFNYLLDTTFHLFLISQSQVTQFFEYKKKFIDCISEQQFLSTIKEISLYGMKVLKVLLIDIIKCGSNEKAKMENLIRWTIYQYNIIQSWNSEYTNIIKEFIHEILDFVFLEFTLYNDLSHLSTNTINALVIFSNVYYHSLLFLDKGYEISKNYSFFISLTENLHGIYIPDFINEFKSKAKLNNFIHCFDSIWKTFSISIHIGDNLLIKRQLKEKGKGIEKLVDKVIYSSKPNEIIDNFLSLLYNESLKIENLEQLTTQNQQIKTFQYTPLCKLITFYLIMNINLSDEKSISESISQFEEFLVFIIVSTTNKSYVTKVMSKEGKKLFLIKKKEKEKERYEEEDSHNEMYVQIIMFGFAFLLLKYRKTKDVNKVESEEYSKTLMTLFYLVKTILFHNKSNLINSSPIYQLFNEILSDDRVNIFKRISGINLSSIENYNEFFNENAFKFWDENLFKSEYTSHVLQYYFDKNKVLVNCIVLYTDLNHITPLFMNFPSEQAITEKSKLVELKLNYKPLSEIQIEIHKEKETNEYFDNTMEGFYLNKITINEDVFEEMNNLIETKEAMNRNIIRQYLDYLMVYQKVKKMNFTWHGLWSDKEVFYTKEGMKFFKEKRVHHYSKEYSMPLLTPVFSMEKLVRYSDKIKLFGHEEEQYPISFEYTKIAKDLNFTYSTYTINCYKENNKHKLLPFFHNSSLAFIKYKAKTIHDKQKTETPQPEKATSNENNNDNTNKPQNNENEQQDNYENMQSNNNDIYCSVLKHGQYYFCKVELKNNKIILFPQIPNNDPNNLYYLNKYNFLQKKLFVPTKKNRFISKIKISINNILTIIKHNHLFFFKGLELFLSTNKSYYLIFPTKKLKQLFLSKILSLLDSSLKIIKLPHKNNKVIGYYNSNEIYSKFRIEEVGNLLKKWKSNKISAFSFLMHLNLLSGRSYHCIEEYPIFPWGIVNFKLETLTKKNSFRNMNMPIGMIGYNTITDQFKKGMLRDYYRAQRQQQIMDYENQLSVQNTEDQHERLDTDTSEEGEEDDNTQTPFREEGENGEVIYNLFYNEKQKWSNEAYYQLKDKSDLYNFPKYYSNKGDVLHYLGRLLPLTYLFINKYTPQNQPHSIMTSLFQTFRNSTKSKEEIKEITPEFFFLFEFMENDNKLKLISNETANQIVNVEIPLWAKNKTYSVVLKHKKALENKTNDVEKWATIIFGTPQLEMIGNLFPKIMQGGKIMTHIKKEHKILVPYCMSLVNKGILPRQIFSKPVPSREKETINELTTTKNLSSKEVQLKLLITLEEDLTFINFYVNPLNNDSMILFSNFDLYSFKFTVEKSSMSITNEKKGTILPKISSKNILWKYIPLSGEKSSIIINESKENIILIQGGFVDNSIYFYKNNEIINYIINKYDNSLITHILMTEDYNYSICATEKGSIILYSVLNYVEWKFKKIINNNSTSFSSIALNNDLQIIATSDYNGYINLYTLPKLTLIRSIKLPENTYASNLFISNYPIPCFVAYSKENSKFFSYSLNAREIEVNDKNDNKKLNQSNQNNQSGSGQQSSESSTLSILDDNIKMTCATIFKSSYYTEYLICGLSDGSIAIRKFPSMKLFNRIKVLKQSPIRFIQLLKDKVTFAILGEGKEQCFVCFNKNSLKANAQTVISSLGFLGE